MEFDILKEENYKKGFHWCKKCKTFKLFEEFYIRKDMKLGLTNECRECTRERVVESTNNRKEEIKEYQKQYGKINRKRLSEYSKKMYHKNKDGFLKSSQKYKSSHKEEIKKYMEEYTKTDNAKQGKILRQQKRRAMKKELKNDLTQEQWIDTLNFWRDLDGNIHCAYCDEIVNNPQQEHIIPLSKNGGYTKSNIIPSCCSCNFKKNIKTIDEFYSYSELFTQDLYEKIICFIKENKEVD